MLCLVIRVADSKAQIEVNLKSPICINQYLHDLKREQRKF